MIEDTQGADSTESGFSDVRVSVALGGWEETVVCKLHG
jgi:hypothetical protein